MCTFYLFKCCFSNSNLIVARFGDQVGHNDQMFSKDGWSRQLGKSGIVKKKAFLTTLQESGGVDLSLTEPATYKIALKVHVWLKAIKEEVDALHSQGTWSLVSLPTNKNLVGV